MILLFASICDKIALKAKFNSFIFINNDLKKFRQYIIRLKIKSIFKLMNIDFAS